MNASVSDYTVTSVNFTSLQLDNVPDRGKIDVKVMALAGHYEVVETSDSWLAHLLGLGYDYAFIGQTSDWSDIQTLIISENQTPTSQPEITPIPTASPATTPSPPPTPYEVPIVGVAFIVAVFLAGLGFLVYLIKRK